jgi:hypothetical protein
MRATLLLLLLAGSAHADGVSPVAQLRDDFERAADRPRILALVSPT